MAMQTTDQDAEWARKDEGAANLLVRLAAWVLQPAVRHMLEEDEAIRIRLAVDAQVGPSATPPRGVQADPQMMARPTERTVAV
jgi:hypothetical protein